MRKRPWGVVAVAGAAVLMNVVFVGCGDDSAVSLEDGGTGSSSGTASSSGGTGDGSSGSTSSGGSSGTTSSGGSSGGSSGTTSSGGSSGTSGTDGSTDATTDATIDAPIDATTDAGLDVNVPDTQPPVDSGPTCTVGGGACTTGPQCCSGTCIGNSCQPTVCKTDTPAQACTSNAECCSGKCGATGTGPSCLALTGGGGCRVEGNACTVNGDCCSKQCAGNKCVNASFCQQTGDVCAADVDCCGGNCAKQGGDALGRCTTIGTASCSPTGTVCTGQGCDNKCCSLSCGPFGTAGVNVCQPPSGCKPQDELCATSGDCCGGPGQLTGQAANGNPNPPLQCIVPAGETLGRCDGPQCLRPGAVCKAPTGACGGSSNNCCESLLPDGGLTPPGTCNSQPELCCSRDALGIPRCRGVNFLCTDAGVPTGSTCSTSADCCGKPCVNGKCAAVCVPSTGDCTTTADCCSSLECIFSAGSTNGTCGTPPPPPPPPPPPQDAGVDATPPPPDAATCSLYGQACTVSSNCCNNVPCSGGLCRFN